MPTTKTFFLLATLLATLFFTAFMPKLTLADIAPALPEPNVNNIWYKTRDKDAVMVFVHGILSDSRDAWANKGDDESIVYWPKQLLTDTTFDDYSIFLGGYHTKADSHNFGMRAAAEQLFQSLKFKQNNLKSVLDHSTIVFVTHSTGGIVVRHMLVRQKSVFRTKKIGLLLIASPSLGSEYANRLTEVLDITDHKMGQELKKNSGLLVELDKDFFKMVSNRELPGLMGQEAFEHHFPGNFLSKFLQEVVPIESSQKYFPDWRILPNTDHFSIVKPRDTSDESHKFLSNFMRAFDKEPHPQCASPDGFKLKFSVIDRADTPHENQFATLQNGQPILTLKLDKPVREHRKQPLARWDDGHYEHSIKLPCVDREFRAQFTRRVLDSRLDKSGKNLTTNICFKRKKWGLDLKFTHHECVEGGPCKIGSFDPGIAEACDAANVGLLHNLLYSTAYARESYSEATQKERWIIPSLETLFSLPPEKRPGFTEFTLQSDPLPRFVEADRFVAAITVNGVSVLEDGWPSGSVSEPYDNQEGLRFSFALQNLGFSGANDGKEIIEVSLRFFLGNILVGEETLTGAYIALRDAEAMQLQLNNGDFVTWTGTYHPPLRPDKFEIFLTSSKKVADVKNFKKRFDKAALTFNKQPLVGVIRPPLPPNESFGVTAGIVLENGQTRFSYNKQYANDLCRHLYSLRGMERFLTLIQYDIYRFENQPLAPGSPRVQWCESLQLQ